MDADEEALTGRAKSKRIWIALIILLTLSSGIGAGAWFVVDRQREADDMRLVEQTTGAAFGCVASVRGDAPEAWALDGALEHMSRMERVTRDSADPTTREERERFGGLAVDAARGCEQLGSLMMEAQRGGSDLYFGVPTKLAQPPEQSDPERWFRRILPKSRAEVLELTRQIRAMGDAIHARREERQLMAQVLPIEGRGTTALARIIQLSPIPRDRERPRTEVWPMPDFVFVVQRGSIARVPCDTRYINRASCYDEYVQTISWEGEVGPLRALERPASVLYWSSFTPTPDGNLWAVGNDRRNQAVVGRYGPADVTPELVPLRAQVDATTRIIAVGGGVAVFPAVGSAWLARDGLELSPVGNTPRPVVVSTGERGVEHGLELEHIGRLSLFGSEQDGWTSRLSPAEGDDVLRRVVDAHSRVREITSLRTLQTGKGVALLRRMEEAPDAIVITHDLGRSWLADPRPNQASE